jgi:dipeptide/tripeptide permease
VGALLSYILSPVFKARLGYGFAFLVPAALMALAVIVLVRGRGGYAVVLPKRGAGAPDSPVFVLAKVLFFAAASSLRRLFDLSSSPPPASFLAGARDGGSSVTAKNVSDASDFFRTARFALLMPFFWCLYDQQGSVWILQARRMRTPGWIEPEQLGVLNTVLVLALLPLLERAVYVFRTASTLLPPDFANSSATRFARRYPALEGAGVRTTALRRMACGMVLAGLSFLLSGLVEGRIQASIEERGYAGDGGCEAPAGNGTDAGLGEEGDGCGAHAECGSGACEAGECVVARSDLSFLWQVPQYFILTLAEIGVSTTGLEFFYQEAPPSLKTASSALFLLTTAAGDILGGVLYEVACSVGLGNADLLIFCGALMFAFSLVFVSFSRTYVYRDDELGAGGGGEGEGGGGRGGGAGSDEEVELSLVSNSEVGSSDLRARGDSR